MTEPSDTPHLDDWLKRRKVKPSDTSLPLMGDTGGDSDSLSDAQAQLNQVDTSCEPSGFICDVGYSTEHYFKNRGKCEVCKKNGTLIWESGWVGSRILHTLKSCRGYFEVDDSGLCWKRQATPEQYNYIIEAYEKSIERDEKAKDATGRKCQTCGTNRGIDYYGMWPDPLVCFCKPHHKAWIFSPAWENWQNGKQEVST